MLSPAVPEHVVRFYEADDSLLEAMREWIGGALELGQAGVVIATPDHRETLDRLLRQDCVDDLVSARAEDRYISLDAAETLSRFMVDGWPHPERFAEVIGATVDRAAAGGRTVQAFGEMVALLALDGQTRAALELERLWNELQREKPPFGLLCAYPIDRLGNEVHHGLVDAVCEAHSAVLPAESYAGLAEEHQRLRAVSVLQQKARRLEAEIAERRRAEEQLQAALIAEQAARHEAEIAVRARDEFLAIASHELRNPVAAVNGLAQLLMRQQRRGLSEEALGNHLQSLMHVSKRLSRLVEDLLDVSRLESGRLDLALEPADLPGVVAELVQEYVGHSGAPDRIALDVPQRPIPVAVDVERVRQILWNLFDNALKYSPEQAQICVTVHRVGDDGVVRVADSGIGIPGDALQRIFEPFGRAPNVAERNLPGLGLGLYVARQLAQAHGGSLWAESAGDGEGSTFVLALPLRVRAVSQAAS